MKHLETTRSALCATALMLGASAASAAPPGEHSNSQQPTWLNGSDSLNKVMQTILYGSGAVGVTGALTDGTLSGAADGILYYNGTGSGNGEAQMGGSTTAAGSPQQPACLVYDPDDDVDTNPGCQEMAPMSRPMQASICDDEESAGRAEGLAVCVDGIVVITNNAAHQQVADTAGDCPVGVTPTSNNDTNGDSLPEFPERKTGAIRSSGAITDSTGATVYTVTDWRDALRLVYTGCKSDDPTKLDCKTQPPRAVRCSDPVRRALVDKWTNLFQGVDCGTNACTELRQAYRNDDASGTASVFLQMLGVKLALVASFTGPVDGQRRSVVKGPGGSILTAISDKFPYCDGGELEAYFPSASDVGGKTSDPIHRNCLTATFTPDMVGADDLCGADGTLPLVRPIRTPPVTGGFPAVQCSRGKFAEVFSAAWNTSKPICPDGTVPNGSCRLPYFAVDRNGDGDKTDTGDRNYDCLNPSSSNDPLNPTVDGRVYNFVKRDEDGNVSTLALDPTLPPVVDTAQWLQNSVVFDLTLAGRTRGGTFPASSLICQNVDATRLIGCLVGNTTCTLGVGAREAATEDLDDDLQEPVRLNSFGPSNTNLTSDGVTPGSYPLSRYLYANALGGFERLTLDCVDRGGSLHYCADQVALAREFYDMTARAKNSCKHAGFVPLATSICQGSNFTDGLVPGAGCGAPKSQAHNACFPL